ncbi:Hypothetical protein CAP_5442 [Chondromyces apiculatus DSM 436]|uniref:PEGA domain-containing protein n=1 Tax=Chondromyces apiculatus DSM 436 TaxID=1192034 RepID=A0A017T2J4_9BACT|nr:Hypothetical protein CAP_5442 [Chondromyces apiculatus DSM 436]
MLADCHAKLGDLLRASELYHALASETPGRKYPWWDNAALRQAKKKAAAIDKRIPTVTFAIAERYEELEIEVDGRLVRDSTQPVQIPPDRKITVLARAKGFDEQSADLTLREGEQRIVQIRLVRLPPPAPKPTPSASAGRTRAPSGPPSLWLGGGYQGFVIPTFMFGFFGDGGRTMLVPGGNLALTIPTSGPEITVAAAYASFGLGETPFKPTGAPDTDYEILESDLQALLATVHVAWDIPLDARGTFHVRVGAGLGIGWSFLGDLYRTQAYPEPGAENDPYRWRKCRGPNDPPGTFLHCNQLDHDADHYFGYVEPSWFAGGYRPTLFPYLALPEIGLAIHPSNAFAIDLTVGASLTGILTRAGIRFGL